MKKMLLIKDHEDHFWSTYLDAVTNVSLDISYLITYFEKEGYSVEVTSFSTFDFTKDYRGIYVLYASSEDRYGGSKDFYEDILLWLEINHAILIPKFQYFRAHHNKVMMELLKQDFSADALKTILTIPVRSLDDLQRLSFCYPCVVKTARGAGGGGVFLVESEAKLRQVAEKISRIPSEKKYLKLQLANFKRIICRQIGRHSNHNVKFVVQNFIPGMTGDNKVLVFGNHYFVLHRMNREGDFRASGSGIFSDVPAEELGGILSFAQLCQQEIDAPHLSLDIGFDGKQYHLIEFQCITFGFKTMSLSDHHYVLEKNHFTRVDGPVNSEEEFCYAVKIYLEERYTLLDI